MTAEEPKRYSREPVSVRLPVSVINVLDAISVEKEVSRSKVVADILERYSAAYQVTRLPLEPNSKDHYALIGPTMYGKTYLSKHLFLEKLSKHKRVIIVDSQKEYDLPVISVQYDRMAPATQNPLFETLQLNTIWSDVERISQGLIKDLQAKKDNASIRFDIADPNAESMIISDFLKRICQVKWHPEVLLIIEEANKYDARAVVSRGRHYGIQVLLISQFPLSDEIMSNCRIVLGSVSSRLIEPYDPLAASATLDLGAHEFLWEESKGKWHKFRLEIGRGKRNG